MPKSKVPFPSAAAWFEDRPKRARDRRDRAWAKRVLSVIVGPHATRIEGFMAQDHSVGSITRKAAEAKILAAMRTWRKE